MPKTEQERLIAQIRVAEEIHTSERWEIAGEALYNIDVVEILDRGLSSEMIAAVFQCSVEDVEKTAMHDRYYTANRKRCTNNLERKYSDYDYSGEPFLGHYPVRK